MSISPGTGVLSATLSGTLSVNASAGIAVFSGLSIDISSITPYKIRGTYKTILIDSDDIFIFPSSLVFTTQPSSTATSGNIFTTQPVVTAHDVSGISTSFTGSVVLSITTGTGGFQFFFFFFLNKKL